MYDTDPAAGANLALQHPALSSAEAKAQISVCSASGIHVLSIPQYIISMVVNMYFNIHTSTVITQVRSERSEPRAARSVPRSEGIPVRSRAVTPGTLYQQLQLSFLPPTSY
jgi:hypothetical protein